MQVRLENLMAEGRLESGEAYNIMPSDCRGDGMDIAIKSRSDESGDYEIAGHLCRVKCTVRVGSRNWRDGIPAGYKLTIDPKAPYTLGPGEKAYVVHRTGNKIGDGYMCRIIASVAIERADGTRIAHNHTPYWIANSATYASHYRSGMSRADRAAYNAEVERLESIAAQINATA